MTLLRHCIRRPKKSAACLADCANLYQGSSFRASINHQLSTMNFRLRVWRQPNAKAEGKLVKYDAPDIPAQASLLEMLDIVNERLLLRGEEPIAFDSDCREGICGTCSLTVNGEAHGPDHPGAACELYMRKFRVGATIVIEPFRVKSFPVIKDLVVDRRSEEHTSELQSHLNIVCRL